MSTYWEEDISKKLKNSQVRKSMAGLWGGCGPLHGLELLEYKTQGKQS